MSGFYPVYHVIPKDDLREHWQSGENCWCKPRVEHQSTGVGYSTIVIHNSLDGREKIETGEAMEH